MIEANIAFIEKKTKKVLVIITTQFVPYGGLTTVMMNYYRAIDKRALNIDFASTNEAPQCLLDEISQYGSKYYNLGNRKHIVTYTNNLYKLIKKNGYDVVHVNGNSATMAIELIPAKISKVPLRIAHVHTTQTEHPFVNKTLLPVFRKAYNRAVAVSEKAGDNLFKGHYIVLMNAIDINHYCYSGFNREMIREKYGVISGEYLIGTVGKLNYIKNQKYLLEVLYEIRKEKKDFKLMIVGGGPLEQELKEQAKTMAIEDAVIFTGMVEDACDYYQAFDYFCLPSLFEGFGLALVEARATGLRCIASEKVPSLEVTGTKKIPLKEGPVEWAKYIQKTREYNRKKEYEEAVRQIKENGLDILESGKILKGIYTNSIVE